MAAAAPVKPSEVIGGVLLVLWLGWCLLHGVDTGDWNLAPWREPKLEYQYPPDPTSPDGTPCNPNYSGCLPIGAFEFDCGQVSGLVKVFGDDVYGLDPDGDTVGCN